MVESGKVITTSAVEVPGGQVVTQSSERQVEVVPTQRQGRIGQIQRAHSVIWFVTAVVLVVVAFRFGLMLLGANADSSFAGFVYGLSYPLVAPFLALFSRQPVYGTAVMEVSTLVAFVVYPLLALALARIVSLTMAPTTLAGESYS